MILRSLQSSVLHPFRPSGTIRRAEPESLLDLIVLAILSTKQMRRFLEERHDSKSTYFGYTGKHVREKISPEAESDSAMIITESMPPVRASAEIMVSDIPVPQPKLRVMLLYRLF